MLKRIMHTLRAVWAIHGQEEGSTATAGHVQLLRWVLLCVATLLCERLLHLCGAFDLADEWQLIVLAGHPFYLSAEDQQVSLLTPGATLALSMGITLYLSAVLLRQPLLRKRNHLCLLAAVAVLLPGCMCVLWHGVLYVSRPLMCILLLWLVLSPITYIRRISSK